MPSRNRSPAHHPHYKATDETLGDPHHNSDDRSDRTLLSILTVVLFGVIWLCLHLTVKAGFIHDPGTPALLGAAILATGAFHLSAGMAAVRIAIPCSEPSSPEAEDAKAWVKVWSSEVVRLPHVDPAACPPHDPDNDR